MWILWFVTLLWAASFSLIGVYLAGQVDGYLAVFIRMLLALAVLLPFWRPWRFAWRQQWQLAGIGAIQIGVMYLLLYHAFNYLSVPEVLLFTIFTPLYVTLLDALWQRQQSLPTRWWLATALAVLGAAVIRYQQPSTEFWFGFLLIQGANLCFAAGQVLYKRLQLGDGRQQLQQFALFFLGATLVCGLAVALFADLSMRPTSSLQWAILIWLGIGASGLGYLLWNMASKQVTTAQLATMNNLLIPAGLLVNLIFWGNPVNWLPLLLGSCLLLWSLYLAR